MSAVLLFAFSSLGGQLEEWNAQAPPAFLQCSVFRSASLVPTQVVTGVRGDIGTGRVWAGGRKAYTSGSSLRKDGRWDVVYMEQWLSGRSLTGSPHHSCPACALGVSCALCDSDTS